MEIALKDLQEIIFFDIESTGTSVTNDRIVQLSAIKTDLNLNVIDKKKILVNPGIPIPAAASAVHGITDEMVKDCPPFSRYAAGISLYFTNCILGGYNIKTFDIPLLSCELNRYGHRWPIGLPYVVDCYHVFREKEKRDLTAAVKFYTGATLEGAHDAENDNIATIEVLKGQMFRYAMELKEVTDFCKFVTLDLAEKIRLNENGIPVYNFGKDKGKSIREFPDFGLWMLKPQTEFTLDTKNTVRRILGLKEVIE